MELFEYGIQPLTGKFLDFDATVYTSDIVWVSCWI